MDAQIKATRELGWKHVEMRAVEVPGFPKGNFHDIPDKAFDIAAGRLEEAGLGVYCFGSAIANWSKKNFRSVPNHPGRSRRCIPRMQRAGREICPHHEFQTRRPGKPTPPEVFRRIGEVTRMFRDAGLQPVHENCMNYGGMSWRHGLELLEKCPGLKWVFDTGNPVFNPDRSKPQAVAAAGRLGILGAHPRSRRRTSTSRTPLTSRRKTIATTSIPARARAACATFCKDALARGYDAGISIEPHVAVVFHDASVKADERVVYESYIRYGRALEKMVGEIKGKG